MTTAAGAYRLGVKLLMVIHDMKSATVLPSKQLATNREDLLGVEHMIVGIE